MRKKVELIKDIVIVILFMSMTFLLFLLWNGFDKPSFGFKNIIAESRTDAPKLEEILVPNRIIIGLGNRATTNLSATEREAWPKYTTEIKSFFDDENVDFMEISEEEYQKFMDYKSIRFLYNYSWPFVEFLKLYNINEKTKLQNIESFNEIAFSSGSRNSLFVSDLFNKKFYRVVSNEDSAENWQKIISKYSGYEYNTSYPIGKFIDSKSKTMMPVTFSSNLQPLAFQNTLTFYPEEHVRSIAQSFFWHSLDFTRRVEESKGSIVYTYGYNKKLLRLNLDGSLEYKESLVDSFDHHDFSRSLLKAIWFIKDHGGWAEDIDRKMRLCLVKAEKMEVKGKTCYRFYFQLEINGNKVYYNGSDPLIIDVCNGQIIYYFRDIIRPLPKKPGESAPAFRETIYPINMLTQNYMYIADSMKTKGYSFIASNGEELFKEVADMIKWIDYGYVRTSPVEYGIGQLIPCWVLQIDEEKMFFDLYDAKPLGRSS